MISFLKEKRKIIFPLLLILAVLAVYWQGFNHDFVYYDDNIYVFENSFMRDGLSAEGLKWAFTAMHASNWHPLTWLSHMLDIELFGLSAGWHHMTSLLFHIFNTLLLFFVLQRMTKAFYRSLFVAALFALHPLHVESVAWIAERKDVLSTFFWMLVMYSYVMYVERPLWSRYCFILLFFILGLLSKPMLVTLPFVLLLLDFWPLGRFDREEGRKLLNIIPSRLIIEKVPLFVLALMSSIVTFYIQQSGGAVRSVSQLSFMVRLENAIVSYAGYLGRMIWPDNLAAFYPHPGNALPMWQVFVSLLVLLLLTFLVLRKAKRFPYLALGWFWYVGTLVPVIGLVQVGAQSMADRYTYIPLIGVFIMIAWGVPQILEKRPYHKAFLSIVAGVLILLFSVCAWSQVRHWRTTIALFEHALEVTSGNYLAHTNIGVVLARNDKIEEAIEHYQKSLDIKPDDADTHNNLGFALIRQGKFEEAVSHFKESVTINPNNEFSRINLAVALAHKGLLDEAVIHFKEALRINPKSWMAHKNLAIAYGSLGKLNEAAFHLREALKINPDDNTAKTALQRVEEAIRQSP
jgi:protein O-mannosyl-transferase